MRKLSGPDPFQLLASRNREALEEHVADLQSMAATMRELDAASHEIANGAARVAAAAERALEKVKVGERATSGMVQGLERIHENAAATHEALAILAGKIDGIGGAIDVIDDLSDRVDLLALNAALEGARAGEAGRGIQVIAAEMRRLAESVVARTRGIRSSIEEIRQAMEAALRASERNRDVAVDGEELVLAATVSLEQVLACVQETTAGATEIRVATLQQQEATEQALRSITSMTEGSRALQQIADELAELAG